MKMKHKTFHMVLLAMPLVLGALSLLSFVLYYYSANHPPYTFTKVIAAGPVLALAGLVITFITRKSRKEHPGLWVSGLVVCSLGFVICAALLALLAAIVAAMLRGDWL